MNEYVNGLMIEAFRPIFGFFASGNYRFYWLYVISGLCVTFLIAYRKGILPQTFSALINPKIWFSASAKIDYLLLFFNSILLYILGAGILYKIFTLLPAYFLLSGDFSSAASASPALLSAGAIGLTVSLFLVADFAHWFTHYLQHRIPVLWEFHKVHHSAESLNFFTSERFHPLDILFSILVKAFLIGSVNVLFILSFSEVLTVQTLFGANAIWAVTNIAGGAMRHAPVSYRYGDFWERWFISPEMHRVHHSENPAHFDKNFGGALSIWDRAFGTIYIPKDEENLTYGIGAESEKFRSLSYVYLGPFQNLLKKKSAGDQASAD